MTSGRAMQTLDPLDRCNVVWDSPSRDASGSMPLGNGDLAANVWVEADGDLLILLAKSDAWDENSINLKLGRIRIAFSPSPFLTGKSFRQRLDLRRATIDILADELHLRLWIDANHPVMRIEAEGASPFEMRASVGIWRSADRVIKTQTGDLFKRLGGPDPYPTIVSADQILPAGDRRIAWCHHNTRREHDGYEINRRLQGLGDFEMPHPLLDRVFGAAMEGSALFCANETTFLSKSSRSSQTLSIYALALESANISQWLARMDEVIAADQKRDRDVARREHEQWWEQFWKRSHIEVSSTIESEQEATYHVTQGYALQRFMNAAAGRAGPIKFNGSLFSIGKDDDPDFRRWGGPGFWFQNQRLIYWPMLAAGDFDLMMPWLKMYRDMLPLQQHRTRRNFNHDGAHYPETITFWGTEVSAHYGWTPFEQRSSPEAESPYVRYYWTCGLELSAMMLSYYAHASDEAFARDMLLPIAANVVAFYDHHYPRGADGKLRIEPSQALETWQDATNPLPELAGLCIALTGLLAFSPELTDEHQLASWRRLLDELPPIPIGEKDGVRAILPAERFDRLKNVENPELYAIFPFRLYGIAKRDLQLARDTFDRRLHRSHECWSQDDIQAAMLGLTGLAKELVTRRASPESHSASRFPAFWDAHHDWSPDMDHGGVLQMALQSMLMQTDGRRIVLLPAWPKDWDADFKLHAPMQTIVEGKVKDGRITELHVIPEHRRKDVIVWSE